MRYLYVLPGLLMVAFAAVQYNDPDAPLWVVIYLTPAVWSFMAAFRLADVRSKTGTRLLWVTVVVGAAAVVYYWPTMPEFWRKEVWRVEETAREGMGVMIGQLVLLAVLAATWRRSAR
jgi:hypothetical protein